jgi:hypothetical protein
MALMDGGLDVIPMPHTQGNLLRFDWVRGPIPQGSWGFTPGGKPLIPLRHHPNNW